MASSGVTGFAPPVPAQSEGRAGGRLVEFLMTGGATLVLFPIAWACRTVLGLDRAELAFGFLTFHAAHVVNDPHFTVTYLLFYDKARDRALGREFRGAQRARYLVAGFVVPALLSAWAIAALAQRSAPALGWLIQLMFFLVGWHYAKQGFGVLTVLSARAGVHFTSVERRVFLAHAFASWAYAWASPADPGREMEERGVVFTSLPHGPLLERVTFVAFAGSALGMLWVLLRRRSRTGRLPPLAPLSGFVVTLWLWTVYSRIDPLMVYVNPALHSAQYLYFVWLLKRSQARESEGPPRFGRPVSLQLGLLAASAVGLGWLVFHGVPDLLDAGFMRGSRRAGLGDLGPTPCFAALFACVNIHHYFMDHVIWRRENPETRHLRDG